MSKKYKYQYVIRRKGHQKIEEADVVNGTGLIVYQTNNDYMSECLIQPYMFITKIAGMYSLYEARTGLFIYKNEKYNNIINWLKDEKNKNAVFDAINHRGIERYYYQLKEYIRDSNIVCDNFNIFRDTELTII